MNENKTQDKPKPTAVARTPRAAVKLVLTQPRRSLGEEVKAGTILLRGAIAKGFTINDLSKAIAAGQVRVERLG